MFEVFRIWKF